MWILCAIRQAPVDFFLRGKAGGEVFGLETLGKLFQHTIDSICSMVRNCLGCLLMICSYRFFLDLYLVIEEVVCSDHSDQISVKLTVYSLLLFLQSFIHCFIQFVVTIHLLCCFCGQDIANKQTCKDLLSTFPWHQNQAKGQAKHVFVHDDPYHWYSIRSEGWQYWRWIYPLPHWHDAFEVAGLQAAGMCSNHNASCQWHSLIDWFNDTAGQRMQWYWMVSDRLLTLKLSGNVLVDLISMYHFIFSKPIMDSAFSSQLVALSSA